MPSDSDVLARARELVERLPKYARAAAPTSWEGISLAQIAAAGLALRRDIEEQWGEGDATAAYDTRLRAALIFDSPTPNSAIRAAPGTGDSADAGTGAGEAGR